VNSTHARRHQNIQKKYLISLSYNILFLYYHYYYFYLDWLRQDPLMPAHPPLSYALTSTYTIHTHFQTKNYVSPKLGWFHGQTQTLLHVFYSPFFRQKLPSSYIHILSGAPLLASGCISLASLLLHAEPVENEQEITMMSSSKKHTSSLVSLTPLRITRSVVNSDNACAPVRLLKVARQSARVHGPITYCDFGLDRLEKFSNANFCHPCKVSLK